MRPFLIILLSIMLPANTQAETAIITIDAACYWAETGVQVRQNRAYRVRVLDMSSVRDWNMRVPNLDGWPRSFRRTFSPGYFSGLGAGQWIRGSPSLRRWIANTRDGSGKIVNPSPPLLENLFATLTISRSLIGTTTASRSSNSSRNDQWLWDKVSSDYERRSVIPQRSKLRYSYKQVAFEVWSGAESN